jgi:hypothetical protein
MLLAQYSERLGRLTGHCRRHAPEHRPDCVLGDLLGGRGRYVQPGQDHVGLQQDALQHDVILVQQPERVGVHLLADVSGPLDAAGKGMGWCKEERPGRSEMGNIL